MKFKLKLPELGFGGAWERLKDHFSDPFAQDIDHAKRDWIYFWTLAALFSLSFASTILPLLFDCLLVLILAAVAWTANEYELEEYERPTTLVAVLVGIYVALTQPWAGYLLAPPALSALGVWTLAVLFARSRNLARVVLPLTAGSATRALQRVPLLREENSHRWLNGGLFVVGVIALYFHVDAIYRWGVPAVQPVLAFMWNWSPIAYVIFASALTAYAVWRMGHSEDLIYRWTPGLTVVGFNLLYPQHDQLVSWHDTWVNAPTILQWVFAAVFLVMPFYAEEPSTTRKWGLRLAGIFLTLFVLGQFNSTVHNIGVAWSNNTREGKLPVTVINKVIPDEIGAMICRQNNNTENTHLGKVNIAVNGDTFDFQCPVLWNDFMGDTLWHTFYTLLPSTNGVVRINADTQQGSPYLEKTAQFPFEAESYQFKSSIMMRHPGASFGNVAQTPKPMVLVQSYQRPRLHWFVMVPSVGGSVVENLWGGFQDYSVRETVQQFHGFFQVPEDIALARTKAWAVLRNPWGAWWGVRDEISKIRSGPAQKDPLAGLEERAVSMQTTTGPVLFFGIEPEGSNATGINEFHFVNADGSVDVVDLRNATSQVKGLHDIQDAAVQTVQQEGLYGLEPQPIIMEDSSCYYQVAMAGANSYNLNRDFKGVVVLTCNGSPVSPKNVILSSSEEVKDAIANYKGAKVFIDPKLAH